MPEYERYEGESQEEFDARMQAKAKAHHERNSRESDKDRELGYVNVDRMYADAREVNDAYKSQLPESARKAVAHIDRKRIEQRNREEHPEWASRGAESDRKRNQSASNYMWNEGHDVHREQLHYIIDNLDEKAELGEIIDFEDGRNQAGLYVARTKDGLKFVLGETDRYSGYGKSGNPNYETKSGAKYGSAKGRVDSGNFISYEDAYKIYRDEAKRKEPGLSEKIIRHLSNYGADKLGLGDD